ncbi:MAG TPA: phage resistance protein, partial [Candidatus Tectomicrobia bacterium]|nr:phage resistance protein [Candidatus Tectomicrobia bacterium]
GNNLNQYGGHLSQVDREQARVLLQNQRDQMRQQMRNAMLAAYGISTMHLEAIDTSHDLEEHFISLNPALSLQPPVGATLKDALDHLFSQALAQQFPAHPYFDMEVKPGSLRRVRDIVRLATQTRDGRVEVERPFRDEVRRIAVPLRLGDMGETHFVLRDDWKSHFLRKKAEEKVTSLTVRQLRAWIDQPEAMGLRKDIQNLVILSFALQNNLTFYLHGGPLEPPLENLDDALELREQALPSEELWQEAIQRAAAILGIVPSPLLTAANVAKFAADVKAEADRRRQAVDRLGAGLRQHLQRLGIDARSAPRLQTVQAALALVRGIAGASKDDIVSVIANTHVATSAPAMGESLRKAEEMSAALENAPWELFERVGQLPRERAPQAQSIIDQVKDALTRDEHVIELKRALKDAQSAAFDLLTSLVEATPPQPPPVQPPVVPPISPRTGRTGDQRGIDERSATTVFASIKKAMESDAELVLDIQWRLYRKGGQSR